MLSHDVDDVLGWEAVAGDAGATGITGWEIAAESTGGLGSRVGIAPSELAPLAGAVIESKRHAISHQPPATTQCHAASFFFFYAGASQARLSLCHGDDPMDKKRARE